MGMEVSTPRFDSEYADGIHGEKQHFIIIPHQKKEHLIIIHYYKGARQRDAVSGSKPN